MTTEAELERTTADSILMAVALQPVVFEIDGFDEPRQTGWSVCVHGFAPEVTGRRLPLHAMATGADGWFPGIPT